MFSGLLVCSDCGSNLRFRFNQGNRDIRYFNCSNNNSRKRTCPTTHYIRVDYLEEIVLTDIRRLIAFTNQYRDEFVDLIERNSGVGPSGDNGFDQTPTKSSIYGTCAHSSSMDHKK